MYQEQRFERILMLLEERGNLSVKEMVDELGVSKNGRKDSQKIRKKWQTWRLASSKNNLYFFSMFLP